MSVDLSVLLVGRLSIWYLVTLTLGAFNVGLNLAIIAREVNTATSHFMLNTCSHSPGTEVTWNFFTGLSS